MKKKRRKSEEAQPSTRAKRARHAERVMALSARLCAQRDYEGPELNFAPINKWVSLGKRTHFLRACFSDLWHPVLSFFFPFLIFLFPFFHPSPLSL